MASSVPGRLVRPLLATPAGELRHRGIRGGLIPVHRSMVRLRHTPGRIAQMIVLPLGGLAGVLLALRPLTAGWRLLFETVLPLLGLPADVGFRPVQFLLVRFSIPYPLVEAAWPEFQTFIVIGTVAAALLLVSIVLPSRFLPLSYFLRAITLILLVSIAWFALASPPFSYPLPRYLAGLLGGGIVILALVPVILGFTFHLLDHALWRKILLTVLSIVHFAVLLPLLILVHAWLIQRFSLLVQPVLFLIFGMLVLIMAFVAFYSWGMSWPGLDDERRERAGRA